LPSISLAAARICRTCGGAPAGAMALPSGPIVASAVGATDAERSPMPPYSTALRSAAMSAALITPSSSSDAASSKSFTDVRVPRPNWPSTSVS
jgi:hypothetical protein